VKTSVLVLLPGLIAVHVAAEPAGLDINEIDRRIAAFQPTAAERRIDEIGWASSLGEALKLGREHERPVFLFTHDGRMAQGRC
jgi:hypothetical protein